MAAAAEVWRERISAVRQRVAEAAVGAGRPAPDVTIVAVTKTLGPEAVAAAVDAGLPDVGENYVQEARDKRRHGPAGARWHLIGPLQRNKARLAASVFDRVHALDSAASAEALSAACSTRSAPMPVLLQVNTAPERDRHGVAPDAIEGLARRVARLPGLRLDGFMTVAPADASGEAARTHFRTLREVRNHVAGRLGVELPHLSMGMSDDFIVAVEEGATLLRLGRVLFGSRGPAAWREGS